jgi:hypothetical protein
LNSDEQFWHFAKKLAILPVASQEVIKNFHIDTSTNTEIVGTG